jgi:hypothetical protein
MKIDQNELEALGHQAARPETEPHYEAGRKQGRAEALAILMQLDPEGGIDKYTGWSTPVGPEDEGAAHWEEEKLRELFAADGALADMMDRAEAEYWKYLGMQDEAESAKNFAANMHNSGKVREVLSRAGEFDLMGHLCTTAPVQPFQQRVQPWMMACFGTEISADTKERNHRFFEESTELVQAHGMTASEAHQLVDYVYGRPVGERAQEVGGVMVTLAALCLANGLDMDAAAETELARIWTKVEAIRAKQAAKPKHSPLPQAVQPASGRDAALVEYLIRYKHCMSYNDSYFSEPAGELKRMVYAADRAHPANVAQAEAEQRQRERMNERFANRSPAAATADFDLPAPNDAINVAQVGELGDAGITASVLEQAAQACDQQADGTNGAYRSACLQCADAVRELRDTAINADDRQAAATNQGTHP